MTNEPKVECATAPCECAHLREKLAVAEAKIKALVAVVGEFCEEVKQLQTALELYRGAAEQRERKGIE